MKEPTHNCCKLYVFFKKNQNYDHMLTGISPTPNLNFVQNNHKLGPPTTTDTFTIENEESIFEFT